MQLLYNLNFSSSIIKVKYAFNKWSYRSFEWSEAREIKNSIYKYRGFLFTNITGCVRIPEAESQIGELDRYSNNLKYRSFLYFVYCFVLFVYNCCALLNTMWFRRDFWLSVFNFAALLWI